MNRYYHIAIIMLFVSPLGADPIPGVFKPAPSRPATEANIIIEEQEVLETCDSEKICVEGRIANNGAKPAYQVRLRIEIGGTKQGRPRHAIGHKLDVATMEPGDRQEFHLTIDRKTPINNKGEEKIIEVGKYNFKIVPLWTNSKPKPLSPKKPAPKKKKP